MAPSDDMRVRIADLRQWAAAERRRAASAAVVAARYEQLAVGLPASLGPARLAQAAMHRRGEACHDAAARLHERLAARLQAQLDQLSATVSRPGFAAAVAAVLGMPSTAVVLLGGQGVIAVQAVSDATARAAHDLEAVMGEGPVHALIGDGAFPIRVTGSALCDRWPRYGPAVTELGVQAVLAVPLLWVGSLGALCAYGRQPAITDHAAAAAGRIAAALARTLLKTPRWQGSEGDSVPWRFGLTDDQVIVHQAVGMVSAQCHCSVSDALALLGARAFASGQPREEIALAVVHGGLRLD